MNQVIDAIMSRRSIRAFKNKAIPFELLEMIVQAGVNAPNVTNSQSWKFTVIQNKKVMFELNRLTAREIGIPLEEYNFYKPDVLILVSCEKDNENSGADSGCALENIFLAAHSLGIGSVWINQLKGICDVLDIREFLRSVSIPDHHEVMGMAALGYADMEPGYKEMAENIVKYIL